MSLKNQRPVGLLQPLQIPHWKWDEIGMDFIVSLPRTRTGYDSIWVVVDCLTKEAHFIPVKTTYNIAVLAELYMSRIVCLHGVPKKIVSDRGTQFTSHFLQQLHEALGTHLKFSSAYHPQKDGQTERTNQILEDMLRACALQDKIGWDKRLLYAEFSYNNRYQASLKMSPFEALYGRNCRTPLHLDQPGERQVFGPDILLEAKENIRIVQENLKAAQSRQRSYADNRRRVVPSARPLPLAAPWDRPVSSAFPTPMDQHARTHARTPRSLATSPAHAPSFFLSTAHTCTRSPVPFRASSLSLALCPCRSTSPETRARRAGHLAHRKPCQANPSSALR
jgi:hypothetical protein